MSRYLGIPISLLVFCISCASTQPINSTENLFPNLIINGDNFDSAIINFESDYGYDRPDGDVLLGEFTIKISNLTYRDGILSITGNVIGTYRNNSEELWNTLIYLLDSEREVLKSFRSDSSGNFSLKFKYSSEYILEFNYIGYRSLLIDLSKVKSQISQ